MSETVSDLFSNDPAVLARMADENIAYIRSLLERFDFEKAPHYERLRGYYAEAREHGDREAIEHYGREMDRYLARWQDARRPMIQQMMQIAMLKEDIHPRTITYSQAEGLSKLIPELPVHG